MKVLITSDLHIDINKMKRHYKYGHDYGFIPLIADADLTIIAGDVAGSVYNEIDYLNNLQSQVEKPVVCVAGNHLGYDFSGFFEPNYEAKDLAIQLLKDNFKDNVKYLENDYIQVGDYIVFGGTMYSDFNLYNDIETAKKYSLMYMNDFRYVHVSTKTGYRCISPDDYIKYFKQFKSKLNKCIKETKKDIIVVTHFAPSLKSISEKYNGKYKFLNPAYASDLEDFILKNKRIKLWCHGHMHDSFDYYIGQCHVVCEPYGYKHETNLRPIDYKGKLIVL